MSNARGDKDEVTVVFYTLNELTGLKALLPQVREHWPGKIIAIDGGSSDGTLDYLKEHGIETFQQKRRGWAGAYEETYRQVRHGIILDFSPDGNSPAESIPRLIAKVREGNDLVIGSRYLPGAHSEDDTLLTRFGNWLFTTTINILFWCRVTDSLVLLRAYRASFIESAGLKDAGLPQGLPPLLTIRAAKIGARIAEIPADEPLRIGGVSKMNPLIDGLRVLYIILRERIFSRPRW